MRIALGLTIMLAIITSLLALAMAGFLLWVAIYDGQFGESNMRSLPFTLASLFVPGVGLSIVAIMLSRPVKALGAHAVGEAQ